MLDSGVMPLFNLREVTEISKVVDVMFPLGREQQSFFHGPTVLFTLHTFLNELSVACNLILEGVRMIT